jgi:putative oxidoreductase
MRSIVPVGRVLFALIFVASMIGHFSSAEIAQASAHGVPLATILVPLAGIIALAGAFLLLVFLVPVTLVMHKFWGIADPQMAMLQKANFLKNTSLIGACLLVMYYGSGPYSLDS